MENLEGKLEKKMNRRGNEIIIRKKRKKRSEE